MCLTWVSVGNNINLCILLMLKHDTKVAILDFPCREFFGPIIGGVLTRFMTFEDSATVRDCTNIALIQKIVLLLLC